MDPPSSIAPSSPSHCPPMDDLKRPSLPEIMRPSGDPVPPPEPSAPQNLPVPKTLAKPP